MDYKPLWEKNRRKKWEKSSICLQGKQIQKAKIKPETSDSC